MEAWLFCQVIFPSAQQPWWAPFLLVTNQHSPAQHLFGVGALLTARDASLYLIQSFSEAPGNLLERHIPKPLPLAS